MKGNDNNKKATNTRNGRNSLSKFGEVFTLVRCLSRVNSVQSLHTLGNRVVEVFQLQTHCARLEHRIATFHGESWFSKTYLLIYSNSTMWTDVDKDNQLPHCRKRTASFLLVSVCISYHHKQSRSRSISDVFIDHLFNRFDQFNRHSLSNITKNFGHLRVNAHRIYLHIVYHSKFIITENKFTEQRQTYIAITLPSNEWAEG